MKRWAKWAICGAMTVAVLVGMWAALSNPLLFRPAYQAPEGLAGRYDAVVRRDRYGVPHILGKTDADASFGLAFAHAEDDFATIQFKLAAARGRASEIVGFGAVGLDFMAHIARARETATAKYNTDLSPATRRMVEGYANGLNVYASAHPKAVSLPGLFPVSGVDVVAMTVQDATFFARVEETVGALDSNGPLPPAPPKGRGGSNSFAVAPTRSSDGSTWLVSNSHQPWGGPFAWYEAHVTSREGMDFAGVLFPGLPLPVTGHNRSLGWTNTSNYPWLSNVYRLQTDKGGNNYLLDGRWRPLEKRRVWIWTRFGPFLLPLPKMTYRSAHGPVIKNDSGMFAVRCACFNDVRQIEQYYRMIKAETFEQWHAAMSMLAMPSFNYTYADKTGKIGLFYNAKFPRRQAGVNWTSILPGDTSNTIWRDYWPFETLPRIVDPRSGYIAEANSTPFDAASAPGDQIHRRDYPRDFLIEPDMTNRSVRAMKLFDATPRVTPADLHRIKFDTGIDPQSDPGKFFQLVLGRDYRQRPDLAEGQALLRTWDWTLDGAGRADALAALLSVEADDAIVARAPFPDVDKTLSVALAFLKKRYGKIDPPLASILRLQHGRHDLPLTGGPDVLRAIYWDKGERGPLLAYGGDSFIKVTRWWPDGRVTANSVQPFGSATLRRDSPHYDDQAPLFAAGKMKPAWFDEEDVRRNTVRSYRPRSSGQKEKAP